eukprot:CAMPEP_0178375010 /NCGR_PEP_ID=MMETSP0689_2-20121128/2667_1 /TAXON_ID=160604 /ORGANISM="Amphidinium massartii, Strain CS-259" /LENGTH=124 /DNA_ID=CAMNT_0019994989 /DNA_START=447 /DNA_END=821 /DNA_ORIENTATION=-
MIPGVQAPRVGARSHRSEDTDVANKATTHKDCLTPALVLHVNEQCPEFSWQIPIKIPAMPHHSGAVLCNDRSAQSSRSRFRICTPQITEGEDLVGGRHIVRMVCTRSGVVPFRALDTNVLQLIE